MAEWPRTYDPLRTSSSSVISRTDKPFDGLASVLRCHGHHLGRSHAVFDGGAPRQRLHQQPREHGGAVGRDAENHGGQNDFGPEGVRPQAPKEREEAGEAVRGPGSVRPGASERAGEER